VQGYALGAFPYPWREWNDQYRDVVRKFWLHGYTLKPGDMATRLSGSHDIFYYRGPNSSINFLTAHDGFTLSDLTMYNEKHNEANAENNRDGTNNNYSWNLGVEGPTEDAGINKQRGTLQKSLMASLVMSAGVPMILMGDEVGRTQSGSNNAYSLPLDESGNNLRGEDSFNGGWALNWERSAKENELLETTKTLIALRKEYLAPVARTFFTGELDLNTSRKDLAWFNLNGAEMDSEDWQDVETKTLSMYVEATSDQGLLMLLNAEDREVEFTLPESKWGSAYRTVFDSGASVIDYEPRLAAPDGKVNVAAHGIQIWFVNRG
jgi:glycogen operon protein